MKHLKKFSTLERLESWKFSNDCKKPNVILLDKKVQFNVYNPIYDKEIGYLESSGTQYINTNIIYNGNYRFIVKFLCNTMYSPEDQASASVFGARSGPTNDSFQFSTFRNGCFAYNRLYDHMDIITNTEYIVEFTRNGKLYINNTEKLSDISNLTYNTPNYIALFALNQLSTITEHFIGRIYYFKLFDENDNIILDLIPVRKGQVGYMFDKVSQQLFENNGTNSFLLGPDKN